MPAVTRLGDECSGHDCFPPRVNDEASTDVFVNGKGVHRLGDHWVEHTCGDNTHDSVAASGSSKVFVNGKAAIRVGDLVACGSVAAQGSTNTFFG